MALVAESWLKRNAPERLKDCPHCGKPRAAHPAPLDSDTRKRVMELCRLIIDKAGPDSMITRHMAQVSEKIIERLEADNE